MDLFTYLMAKNDHNTSVNRDLFSYLLGKGQSGTYQTFTGTSITANNTKKGKMKLKLTPTEMSQTGTPTPSSPIPVNVVSGDNEVVVCGKNLFDKDIITTGKTYTSTGGISNLASSFVQETYISVLPNTAYTLSTTNDYSSIIPGEFRLVLCEYNSSKSFIQRNLGAYDTHNVFTITTTANTYYLRVCASNLTLDELQLEKGSTATSYEPYQSTSYPIHLGEHWLGWIGDYKDRFFKNIPNTTDYKSDLEDNEWYLEKKIRHLSLAIADMNNNEDYPGWKNVPYIIEDLQGQGYIENLTSFKSNITDKRYSIAVTTYNSILYLDKTYGFGLTQTQWKTNYPNLVFELYYGLQTPTYTPITGTLKDELEAVWRANSYKGTTNISQVNNDLAFEIEAEIKVGN